MDPWFRLWFHCRGTRFDPGQGTKIPHATQHGQKLKISKIIKILWELYTQEREMEAYRKQTWSNIRPVTKLSCECFINIPIMQMIPTAENG